jgi:uncharacterized RDD family membrane protein YckC
VPGHQPPPPRGPGPAYASFWARLGALLLDGLIIGLVPWIAAAVFFAAGAGECTTVRDQFGFTQTSCSGGSAVLVLLGVLVLLVGTVVAAWFVRVRPVAEGGQSPGQKVAGVQVIDARTGAPGLGAGRSWGRFLFAYFISSAICYLGFLWMLWDDRDQTWHDKVADSLVIAV